MSASAIHAWPRQQRLVRFVSLALLTPALGMISSAAFAYWEVIPRVAATINWEDNPRYFTDSAKAAAETASPGISDDAMATTIETSLDGSYQTPSNQIRLSPRIRKTDFLKNFKDLNDDSWMVDLYVTHQERRGLVGLSASYEESSVRTSAFESVTADSSGGSGLFTVDDTQRTKEVRPFLNYRLSPRNRIGLSFSAADIVYEQTDGLAITGGYFDYTYKQTALEFDHYLNEKNFFQVSLNGSGFDAEQPDGAFRNSTESFSASAAYNVVITLTLTANANFGVSRSTVDVLGLPFDPLTGAFCPEDAPCSASDDERNFVGGIGLQKRSELTTLNFNVSRSLAPRSNGVEVVQDRFQFFINRTVTPRLDASAGATYSTDAAVGGASREDRTYLSIDSTLTWRLTPTLSTYGKYSYIFSEYSFTTETSEQINHRLYLGFIYRGVGFRR